MQKLTIATRGSKLALWQANHIKSCLENKYAGLLVELLVLKTQGDIIQDVPLAKIGGKGLFVKEIEEALLDGRADIAVHSMKDVPMELPEGLILGLIPKREEPSDVLLSVNYDSLNALPQKAKVGTSSLRRQAQLLALRPDLEIISLRGNVDTRLRKLIEGQFDAIVMASAGLNRLGLAAPKSFKLVPPDFLPAAGQGALGIEYAESRKDIAELLSFLEDRPTRICVEAERGFLAGLEGGCQVPIAAFAKMTNQDEFILEGLVADIYGKTFVRNSLKGDASGNASGDASGNASGARQTGFKLAQMLKDAGADKILAELYCK
ncbi:hydroxymethylbilane synthase [Desulfovibrio litoralis]|uniref:Porphobilinogen deaminase n=1 Tax=Desulfovibrio litoralis DSM 11393 TaxID=1121455 RepID=A0A1M7T142_9BACT|nr:hydroxymethylbilane synthase [Desulfovibrio litoralis]SHN64483.1 hydroxymethylbilane synthase [Desulfovibrio litoralis DSM 11393]